MSSLTVRWPLFLGVALAVTLVGCNAETGAISQTIDSAGIQIVWSPEPEMATLPVWEVDQVPFIDIGAEDGSPEGYLYRVRDALTWQGSIVVVNGGTDDLRVFARNGQFQRTIGRQGAGPGEFTNLGFVRALSDDSLITWDFRNDRLSVFDASGTFVRSAKLERHEDFGAFLSPIALLGGGHLLTMSRLHLVELGNESGRVVDSSMLAIHDVTGKLQRVLGRYPTGERMRYVGGGVITTLDAPFARELQVTAWEHGYCVGFNAVPELRCRPDVGEEDERRLRFGHRAEPVTADAISAYVEDRLAVRSERYGRAFRRTMDDLVYPEAFPVFETVLSDTAGNVWVQDYARRGSPALRWRIFGREGRLEALVRMPAGLEVLRVYPDAVLGLWRDSLDVEHVRMHRLIQ